MGSHTETFSLRTKGETDIIDITARVESVLAKSGLTSGVATVFVPGATAGISTIEHEGGLLEDLKAAYERFAPRRGDYRHDRAWGDGNGFSHVRASLTGQARTVPFSNGKLALGTWQQIVLIDFDNRPRERDVVVQVLGE